MVITTGYKDGILRSILVAYWSELILTTQELEKERDYYKITIHPSYMECEVVPTSTEVRRNAGDNTVCMRSLLGP